MAIETASDHKWNIQAEDRTDEQLERALRGPFPYTLTDIILRPLVGSLHRLAAIITGHKLNKTPPI